MAASTLLRLPKRSLMTQVLGRMTSNETLISDRHIETMLVSYLSQADHVEDHAAAQIAHLKELAGAWDADQDSSCDPTTGKPFVYRDGVAVIPVHGILINRFNYCWGFITGYDFIRKQKNLAIADNDVKLIVYDHNTPGGEAAGCAELAQEIFEDRKTKPSMTLVNSLSASAGYWLGAASTKMVCAPSGSVGSIGVYMQFMNIAKMLEMMGVEMDFVQAGKYKTSGNSYSDMSKDDRAYFQNLVDLRETEFFAAVAEFRGIDVSVVKGTEARVMRPPEAISLGLIDSAEAPSTAVSSFVAELGDDNPTLFGIQEDATVTVKPDVTTTTTLVETVDAAAVQAATKTRIKGITTHEEAKGRESQAEYLAFSTDMSVDEAVAMLKVSAKVAAPVAPEVVVAKPAVEQSAFVAAMNTGDHPGIKPGDEATAANGGATELTAAQKAERIMGDHALAKGAKRTR